MIINLIEIFKLSPWVWVPACILWLAGVVLAWGYSFAYWQYRFPLIACEKRKEDNGRASVEAALVLLNGPLQLIFAFGLYLRDGRGRFMWPWSPSPTGMNREWEGVYAGYAREASAMAENGKIMLTMPNNIGESFGLLLHEEAAKTLRNILNSALGDLEKEKVKGKTK